MHTITFSTSTEVFKDKPTKYQLTQAKFTRREGTVMDLYQSIIDGHITMYTFKDNKRKNDNFIQTSHILLDYDDTSTPPQEAEQVLINNGLTPCFYYTTASHTEEKPRYRLCFVLKNPVTDAYTYKRLWNLLTAKIESIIPTLTPDKKTSDAARMSAGYVKKEHSSCKFNFDYTEVDFEALDCGKDGKCATKRLDGKSVQCTQKDYGTYFKDYGLLKDVCGTGTAKPIFHSNADMVVFFDRYRKLIIPSVTPVGFGAAEEYKIVDTPVYEVRYPFHKLRDKQKRKKCLYMWGCIRRLIKPEATFDDILVTLIEDAYRKIETGVLYWDSKEGKPVPQNPVTIKDIIKIAADVMDTSEAEIKDNINPTKRKIMFNPNLKFKPGYKNKLRTLATMDIVNRLKHDGTISLENLNRELETIGLKPIKEATYRRKYVYVPRQKKEKKQDTGKKPVKFKKTKQMAKFYNPNISFNACFEMMKSKGIDISRSAVYKYYKKMKENFENQENSCTFAVVNS